MIELDSMSVPNLIEVSISAVLLTLLLEEKVCVPPFWATIKLLGVVMEGGLLRAG
jgi:hypothetical protein